MIVNDREIFHKRKIGKRTLNNNCEEPWWSSNSKMGTLKKKGP